MNLSYLGRIVLRGQAREELDAPYCCCVGVLEEPAVLKKNYTPKKKPYISAKDQH